MFDFFSGADFSLQAVFSSHAREVPAKVFCSFNGRDLTYQEAEENANRVAHALINEFGVAAGDRVAVYSPNCLEFLTIMLALHRIGAVYVPTSVRYSPDELAYQIWHCEPRVVVVGRDQTSILSQVLPDLQVGDDQVAVIGDPDRAGQYRSLDELCAAQPVTTPNEAALVRPGDLAMIMYTSGTTARPKGVMFSFGNLRVAADNAVKHLRWGPEDRFLHYFPLYHANGGLYGVWPAVLAQSSIVMVPKFTASGFSRQLSEFGITFAVVNATNVSMIMAQDPSPYDRDHHAWRMMLGLTVRDPADILAFERRFNTRLIPSYGLTESLGISVVGDAVGPRKVGSAGRVVRGLKMRLVDDQMAEVAAGGQGIAQFQAESPHCLTMGYYKDPEQTVSLFRDGWLHSGDILSVDADGYAFFVDREKDMIKRSGYNVAPAEIERVVLTVPGVTDAAAVPAPDDIREQAIVVYAVRENRQVTDEQVIEFCAAALADYKVPQFVEFIEELPRDILGKIDRKLLRSKAERTHHVRG